MTKEELKSILVNHKKWLNNEDGGVRADLCGANLRDADLCGADLCGANLFDADLFDADLCGANLRGANLCYADLCGADLCGADLFDADLRGADLRGANLRGANLRGANLRGANLFDAKNIPYIPLACPSDGAFIGWKKVKDYLIKLLIPEDAKRSSATTSKCRCDKAEVLEVTNIQTGKQEQGVINYFYNQETVYNVGKMVYPDSFDEDRWNECSHGIHFFVNKEEAKNY